MPRLSGACSVPPERWLRYSDRIYHSLHEIGIHAGIGAKLVCYGVALVSTLISAAVLLGLGF